MKKKNPMIVRITAEWGYDRTIFIVQRKRLLGWKTIYKAYFLIHAQDFIEKLKQVRDIEVQR